MNESGIPMKCPNCGYKWNYGGKRTHSATCPDCKKDVKIKAKP